MKNKFSMHFVRAFGRVTLRRWASAATALSALWLGAANLAATTTVTTISGGPYAGYVDGNTADAALFHTPIGLTLDSSGQFLFVADRDNNAVRTLDLVNNDTFTFTTAGVWQPVAVALDGEDNLFALNQNGTIAVFDWWSDYLGTIATGLTSANAMTMGNSGSLFVTGNNNQVIQVSPAVTDISVSAVITNVATVTNAGTVLQGIAQFADSGYIAVCDSGNHGIFVINPATGTWTNRTGFHGAGDHFGTRAFATFNQPCGLAAGGNGTLVVADTGNNRVKIVDAAGTVINLYGVDSSFWVTGPGTYPGWYDGIVARGDINYNAQGYAESRLPNGVLITSSGSVYTTEDYYHLIRLVTGGPVTPPPAPPPPPPAAPVILTILTINGQVSLTWSTVTGTNITYNVERSPSSGGPYTLLTNTSATSYTDTGVIAGTTYYYVVLAVGAGGVSQNSAQVSVTVPLPPVPDPQIGYVNFPATSMPIAYTSVFQPVSSAVFNNDAVIVIRGTPLSSTYYTYGFTTNASSVPNPTSDSSSIPSDYQDGLYPSQVAPYTIPQVAPFLTIKAMGAKADGSPNSAVVQAAFQFITANPNINGNNAAQFTISDSTVNAHLYYTTDGSDPSPTNGVDLGVVASTTNVWTVEFPITTNTLFKVRAYRNNYQPSAIVTTSFSPANFVPNIISFGFVSGEASSAFIASAGQTFYSPVTLSPVSGATILSLQFNLTVTNVLNAPPVDPDGFLFQSMLVKPDLQNPGFYDQIPPYMFLSTNPVVAPPPGYLVFTNIYNGTNIAYFEDLTFVNSSLGLMGVGWLERTGEKYLYDTTSQTLITFSMAHDTVFNSGGGKVILGGYAFQVPTNAAPGQQYQIQIGRPSATSDGIGDPGSSVYINTPINGSLTNGAINSIKLVTVGQTNYIAGDCAPFRWFNAGDFGDRNLDNSDVMQVFQSAIYNLNYPPPGSDFFDSMDSCGGIGVDKGNGYLELSTLVVGPGQLNPLFSGNDTNINQIAFGDGNLDVCDVYVTFRRSLDPSLTWFIRFWTNGVRGAQIVGNPPTSNIAQAVGAPLVAKTMSAGSGFATNFPTVNFASGDSLAAGGQTVQIPITAQIFGTYPLRVLMLNLTVHPLDGSPALTSAVQFTPNPALGAPTLTSSSGLGNYAASWLSSSIAGLTGNAQLGTLTVQIPAGAPASAAYAVHFDHASASPNGLASFPNHKLTGLITLSDRSSSSYGDGIPDSWRLRYFGTVNNLLSQANADADGDGMTNLQEYNAGTDPTDPQSCLRTSTDQAAAQNRQDCVIHWPSVTSKNYIIERSTSLFAPSWTPVSTNTGTGTDMEWHDTSGGTVRFYRVRVAP